MIAGTINKAAVREQMEESLKAFNATGVGGLVEQLNERVFSKGLSQPLLEYCGSLLQEKIPENHHADLCIHIEALKIENGHLIVDKIQRKGYSLNCDDDCPSCTYNYNPMLAGLDLDKRLALDDNRNQISFKKGEAIFKEGVYPFGLYCLRKGKVKITKIDAAGNEIIVNLHKEVTFLGIADFISNQYYQSNCIALEETEACLIQPERIHALIAEEKVFASRLMSMLASHYNRSNQRLLALTKKNMSARLADALLEILDVFGETEEGYLNVYLKRSEIAQLSSMSQANIIRKLSSFQESGIIALEGKQIRILDKNQLEKESQML